MTFKDKETAQAYYRKRRIEKRRFLAKLKDVPCKDCEKKFPHYCMEFDHVPERGKKKFPIASGANWSLKEGALIDELKKCDVVCAICHRIRTYKRSGKDQLE